MEKKLVEAEAACEACGGRSTGHCDNPDFAGYELCDDCIAEYDSRPHGVIEEERAPFTPTDEEIA